MIDSAKFFNDYGFDPLLYFKFDMDYPDLIFPDTFTIVLDQNIGCDSLYDIFILFTCITMKYVAPGKMISLQHFLFVLENFINSPLIFSDIRASGKRTQICYFGFLISPLR